MRQAAPPDLNEDDLTPLLQATASRSLDTCLRGARGLAVLGDPRAFGLLLQLSREEDASARVERLLLVFNKFDLLQAHYPHAVPDSELLELCQQKFAPVCAPLLRITDPQRVRRVLTVLGRGDLMRRTQGGPVVQGEAAGPLVEAFQGPAAADGDVQLGH